MPVCPNCQSLQPDGAVFCDECGASLTQSTVPPARPASPPPTTAMTTCPTCGKPVVAGEAFCDNCGAALGATPPPPVAAEAPSGGLTCVSCDALLEPGSQFCDMCGTPVRPAPPAPPVPPSLAPTERTLAPPPSAVPPPAPLAAPPPQPSPPPPNPPRLAVQGSERILAFPQGRSEFVLGREDPISNVFPEIDLTECGGEEGGVSRRHARIFIQGSQFLIEDLNSTNYTFVNQQRLTPGQPHPLNDGDELRLGRVKLTFHL